MPRGRAPGTLLAVDEGGLLHALVQHSEDLIIVIDDDLRILWASDRITTMLGYRPSDAVSWNILDAVHPDDAAVATANLALAFERRAPTDPTIVRVRQQDGLWCWVDIVGGDLSDLPDLAPARYALYLREVNERQETERHANQIRVAEEGALRRSEERFRALLLHASDAIVVVNADGTVEQVNPDRGLFGPRPVDAILGHNAFDWVHPDDVDELRVSLAALTGSPGTTITQSFRIVPTRTKTGGPDAFEDNRRWRWIEAAATNMLDEPTVGRHRHQLPRRHRAHRRPARRPAADRGARGRRRPHRHLRPVRAAPAPEPRRPRLRGVARQPRPGVGARRVGDRRGPPPPHPRGPRRAPAHRPVDGRPAHGRRRGQRGRRPWPG